MNPEKILVGGALTAPARIRRRAKLVRVVNLTTYAVWVLLVCLAIWLVLP